jgi:eukaryotic-like serine/threonine-protein kinase
VFNGDDVSDTLAAVLRHPVDFDALPRDTPPALRQLLRQCLERDPRNRLHDMADARIVLEEIARGGVGPAAPPVASRRGVAAWWLGVVALTSLVVGGAAVAWLGRRPAAPAGARVVRLTVVPPAGVENPGQPAIAPDGSFVVFVGYTDTGGSRLYLQRFDRNEATAIDHTDGAAQPLVSPDGRWIGFLRSGHLERIRTDGSDALVVADVATPTPGSAWTRDGQLVVSTAWLAGLSTVSVPGGSLKPLLALDAAKGEKGLWYPYVLPDERRVLYTIWHAGSGLNDAEIGVLDLASGQSRVVGPGAQASFVAPDMLVYFRAGGYYAVRVDPITLAPAGDPVRVLEDAGDIPPEGYLPQVALTPGGTAAYATGRFYADATLAWVAPGGRIEQLPFPPRGYTTLSIAPDGRRAAAGVLEGGRYIVRLLDFDRGTDDRVDLPDGTWSPVWHPDGRRVAVRTMRKGDFDIYLKDLTRSDPMQPLLTTDADEVPQAWTPDGRQLIIEQSNADGHYDLKALDVEHPTDVQAVADHSGNEMVEVSPDGRWLAWSEGHTGRLEVYVAPVQGHGVPVRVSPNGGQAVAWLPKTHELLYARASDIMAVTYHDEGGVFQVTGERLWATVPGAAFDRVFAVGAGGRVLTAVPTGGARHPQLRVILNWNLELEQRLR